ncbi:TPA: YraN family protein [Candidatus Falkowbacteria bacterium]|nr:YraN family protein [Candidatus Falkowbacteria bacterium]
MTTIKKKIGDWGEDNAARFLINRGYQVIEKNYHSRYGEIDLICLKDDDLVFVEVKTRRAGGMGRGEDAVDARKKRKIRLTIDCYLASYPSRHYPRFDVIVIELDGVKQMINHYQAVEI